MMLSVFCASLPACAGDGCTHSRPRCSRAGDLNTQGACRAVCLPQDYVNQAEPGLTTGKTSFSSRLFQKAGIWGQRKKHEVGLSQSLLHVLFTRNCLFIDYNRSVPKCLHSESVFCAHVPNRLRNVVGLICRASAAFRIVTSTLRQRTQSSSKPSGSGRGFRPSCCPLALAAAMPSACR